MIVENSQKATEFITRHNLLVTKRSTWNSHWTEVAERILPRKAEFEKGTNPSADQQRGEKRTQKVFDSTGALALERFSAAMESMLTPRNARWHKLRPIDEALRENHEVEVYLDEVTRILFANRYAPKANFASQASELYLDLGAFGTGVPLEQSYPIFDAWGRLIGFNRDFELEAHQVLKEFGEDNTPVQIKSAAKVNPLQRFRFLHVVREREEYYPERRDALGMKFMSCYVSYTGSAVLRERGYRSMPYMVSRYTTSTKEEYGRSPAMTVLPTLKTLNEMSKTVLRGAQKMVNPPLMLTEDGAMRPFDLREGALNYGAVDAQGNALVQPLNVGGDVGIGIDLIGLQQKTINEAFLVTLFQILVETPAMTATEAMLRAQEKGALLAPTMGRQQSEFLGPLIQREIDILANAGAFPPMPQALIEAGGELEIEYESPIMLAQKAGDGVAILNTLQSITPLAQIDPSVLDPFDMAESARILAEVNGYPAKALLSKDQIEAKKEQQSQQAQVAQLLEAAPIAASSARDLAQAQSLAGSAPNQQAPAILPGI
jgi:hypothetical protein